MSGAPVGVLARAAEGDEIAVRECISRFGPMVWGLARRLSPTGADAEDATQEIFLELWEHGGRYDPERASEETFVAMIARRRLIDRRRRAKRRPTLEPFEAASEAAAPGLGAELVAEAAIAARAMSQLRPEQREVLRLSVAEGLTHEEIAAQSGMPLGTVKAHARRGLIRIRRLLIGEDTDGERVEEENR